MKHLAGLAIVSLLICVTAHAQIYHVARMNTEQIASLDRQKTVVILTGGILEEHGPHLPSFTDGYSNEWLAQRLAEAIVQRPGYSILLFPTIPLGHGGANEIGNKKVFPGTYSIRRATLRAVFMDLATELGEQGFRWIFILHGHGAPYHNLMLDQACEYFRDVYGGRMIHLRGLEPTAEQITRLQLPTPPALNLSQAEKQEVGAMDEHAGFEETSRLMFLRPDLVSAAVTALPAQTTNNPEEFFKAARVAGWRGYLSSPRLARASYGARLQEYRSAHDNALAVAILEGKVDERDIPRYSQRMTSKEIVAALAEANQDELNRERKQQEWMTRSGIK
jgi:creatinine amidohydrolase